MIVYFLYKLVVIPERTKKMLSLTQEFVKEIERRILTGQWAIGEKIPPVRELAEEFHVSRSVINAGIAELCSNGYLTTVPRKYICVSDWRRMGNFALLSGLIDNGLYDENFYDDLFEGRMTIGKAIAGKAAMARTAEDLAEIEKIIERERHCVTPMDSAEADKEFHHAIASASHNIVYSVILNSFNTVSDKLMLEFYEKEIDRDFVLGMHEKICEAIKSGDIAGAEENMAILLDHGEREMKNKGGHYGEV